LKISTLLRLGRVSNLPTVWSNTFAGAALASHSFPIWLLVGLGAGFSASYTAGMFLNDAFDASFDRIHRPERPIASGEATPVAVFRIGFSLLAAGFVIIVAISSRGPGFWRTLVAAFCLAAAIVLYDAWHKQNPVGPVVMGACRALVYLTAGLAVADSLGATAAPATAVLAYLVGLTAIAKREISGRLERLWPMALLSCPLWIAMRDRSGGWLEIALAAALVVWIAYALSFSRGLRPQIGRTVGFLIAGVSLVDALFISTRQAPLLASVAILCFVATLLLQRRVPGT
jgi:4-hydroxybenzoate polyprenyltransferase